MQRFNYSYFSESVLKGANFVPIVQSWPADLETPLTTWLKVGNGKPPGVLLESVDGGENIGRWSVIATDPLWVASARGDRFVQKWRDGRSEKSISNPFHALRKCLEPYRTQTPENVPPLGQLFGMWGYELIHWIEPTVPVHKISKSDPPDGVWMFMDSLLVFDQVRRLITAVVYADLTINNSEEKAFEIAVEKIKSFQSLMSLPLPKIDPLSWNQNSETSPLQKSNFTKNEFEQSVIKAKENIASGDIFQIVLSQRFESNVDQNPFDLYRSLRIVNPSPYMAFFDFGDWQLIGSSPEVMVKAEPTDEGILASLRPIAGTRPRGKNQKDDQQFQKDLLADPKERAEHVMLLDLGRNDLGRVCKPGSVEVKQLMTIEKYSHVMHIVSQVEGLLSSDKDVWDLLMASFPAGTVSGAPKIRAMQLIYELEDDLRGPYSGVYGAMDLTGALNTAITIRTIIVQKNHEGGLKVQVQAGAGVVADSVPALEFQETVNKAKGMMKALACLESKSKSKSK
tara:strand:- start:299 stop:1831 length:1533 start_codon:yes stop_codon:yes gene_type:complete